MSYMQEEIFEQPGILRNCLTKNQVAYDKILEEYKSSHIQYVVIAARGTSDHAAIYGKYLIESLTGLPVVLAAPSIITRYHANLKLDNALVIGISQSGRGGDVTEFLRYAGGSGCLTVAIINTENSELSKAAKYNLLCGAGLEKSVAATKTFTSQMLLIGLLAAVLAEDKQAQDTFHKVPEAVEETLKAASEIKTIAARYRFMNECFVLARGSNYSIALESALKLQETSYVKAKAFATSDFYHGPIAMVDQGTPVLVYASEGDFFDDAKEMLVRLNEIGADILVVSDTDAVGALGTCAIKIPSVNSDIISPFCNAVVAQYFACCVSAAKGCNPDKPRLLNKITNTL